ncbi:MAG: hypothetical protein ABGY96_20615 [bacterium]
MNKKKLEKIAIGLSCAIVVGWGIFWVLQIIDVREMLELAYG